MPFNPPYFSAEGAILGLTLSLAHEGCEHGILVDTIGPGGWTRLAEDRAPDSPHALVRLIRCC